MTRQVCAGRGGAWIGREVSGQVALCLPVHTCVRGCREESGALEPPDFNIQEELSPRHLLSANTIDRPDDFIDSKSTEG